jgi:hypothetical protein
MRKYISVNTSTNDEGGLNINVDVIDDMMGGVSRGSAVGYIESSDLDDLYTPASVMVQQLTGECDEDLVDNLAAAFRKILTPRPTVSINGEHFA